tara:strand:+ start:137 stop:310 length:174 start_codon:yes stop_codon:yes gene_type:complete
MTYLYVVVLAAVIFVVELLFRFVVRRGFVNDGWFMQLLFRVVVGGALLWALGERFTA